MAAIAPRVEARTGAILGAFARYLALFGGVILAAIAGMTVASVIGRAMVPLGLGPVPGDFELVQVGCAVAVFSFLPWCQLNRGHVTVDILVERFPRGTQRGFLLLGDIALTAVAFVAMWQLYLGMLDKFCPSPTDPIVGWLWTALGTADQYCWVEATYELNMPVWWGYALGLVGAAAFFVTGLYTVWRALNEVLS